MYPGRPVPRSRVEAARRVRCLVFRSTRKTYRHTWISWPSRTSVPSSSKLAATPSDANSLLIHSAISMTCLRYAASPDTLGIATARDSRSTNCFSFAARYSVTFCGSEPVIVKEVREVWGMRESRSVSHGDQTERWILPVERVLLFFLLLRFASFHVDSRHRSSGSALAPCPHYSCDIEVFIFKLLHYDLLSV